MRCSDSLPLLSLRLVILRLGDTSSAGMVRSLWVDAGDDPGPGVSFTRAPIPGNSGAGNGSASQVACLPFYVRPALRPRR